MFEDDIEIEGTREAVTDTGAVKSMSGKAARVLVGASVFGRPSYRLGLLVTDAVLRSWDRAGEAGSRTRLATMLCPAPIPAKGDLAPFREGMTPDARGRAMVCSCSGQLK